MYKLTIDGLHKSYGDHEVLKGVSLKASVGDVICLIGASGSGKSTFLRCINFLEQPNDGAMSLDGQPVRMVSDTGGMRVADPAELQRIRTRLAMVFQHFNLWSHMTVLENITMAPRRVLGVSKVEAEARARKYLDKVGLHGSLINTLRFCPVASSSASPLPAHWRWNLKSCCSTSLHRPSTQSWSVKY
jgi:histidine transport system ATP-binding protein